MCESCFEKGEIRTPGPGADGLRSRRFFLMIGLGALVGCAKQTALGPMPSPPWPDEPSQAHVRQEAAAIPTPQPPPLQGWRGQVLPRSAWAQGEPIPLRMNRMSSIRYITIHHDGMDAFFATDLALVAAHLEGIRRLHRRKGWGDIGYHFAVDPAGRVWEARPLGWQGAHVKDHNPGNIGIVVLGNFEVQTPSVRQLEGVRRHVQTLMRAYNVPRTRVYTHRDWGAKTACPGGTLQSSLQRLQLTG